MIWPPQCVDSRRCALQRCGAGDWTSRAPCARSAIRPKLRWFLAAHQLGWDMKELRKEWPRVGEVPFTSERKRMTTIHRMVEAIEEFDSPIADAPYVFYTKGAVDSLLDVTSQVLLGKEVVPLIDELRAASWRPMNALPAEGQRVLGVAVRLWFQDDQPPRDPDAHRG